MRRSEEIAQGVTKRGAGKDEKPIALIGLPGAGKSTVARLLGRELGLAVVDLDTEIERELKMSIPVIFAMLGEGSFRAAETRCLERLLNGDRCVIATGGGCVLKNSALLREKSVCVYLKRSIESIARGYSGENRPLAQSAEQLAQLYAARRELYERAAQVIVENEGTAEECAERIRNAVLEEGISMGKNVAKKKQLCVVGHPIAHSRSPEIHGGFIAQTGADYSYTAIDIPPSELEAFVARAKAQHIAGFNVTMPLKREIIPLLDEADPLAERLGSVNTVVNSSGRLKGYNTDAMGFIKSLEHLPKTALVIGSGGAGLVCAHALAAAGVAAAVCSRSVPRGDIRAHELGFAIHNMDDIFAHEKLTEIELVVNATPLGMEGCDEDFEDLSFVDRLGGGCLVYDLIYAPEQTSLLRRAAERGLKTQNGYAMLVWQAALAFEKFTGIMPQVEEAL